MIEPFRVRGAALSKGVGNIQRRKQMSKGYYYLHSESGDLIYKRALEGTVAGGRGEIYYTGGCVDAL